jgi:hypothetical protein
MRAGERPPAAAVDPYGKAVRAVEAAQATVKGAAVTTRRVKAGVRSSTRPARRSPGSRERS